MQKSTSCFGLNILRRDNRDPQKAHNDAVLTPRRVLVRSSEPQEKGGALRRPEPQTHHALLYRQDSAVEYDIPAGGHVPHIGRGRSEFVRDSIDSRMESETRCEAALMGCSSRRDQIEARESHGSCELSLLSLSFIPRSFRLVTSTFTLSQTGGTDTLPPRPKARRKLRKFGRRGK